VIPVDPDGGVRTWVLPPPPPGDAAAVRALAAAARYLAEEVRRGAARCLAALPGSWQGQGATSGRAVADGLADDAARAASGLEAAAGDLDDYARRLEEAQHRHRSAWATLATIAGVVVVTGVVVAVTVAATGGVGAAAAVAEVDAGVAALGAATEAAAAAEASLVASLARTALGALRALRPLWAFVRPQLATAEAFTGLDAGTQLAVTGRVDPARTATGFAVDLVVPGAAVRLVRDAPPLLGYAATGVVLAGGETGRELAVDGRVDPVSVGVTGLAGGAGSFVSLAGTAGSVRLLRARSARGIPLLDRADATTMPVGAVVRLPPGGARFSQKSVSAFADRERWLRWGWAGTPLDVVVMPDGLLTSVDNRRLLAAARWRVAPQARVHAFDEPLPPQRALQLTRRGKRGAPQVPTTWGEGVQLRLRGQGAGWHGENPHGTVRPPRVKR